MFSAGGVDTAAVPAGLQLATIGRRVGGLLLDQAIIVVPVVLGAVVAGVRPGDSISDDALLGINLALTAVSIGYHTVLIGLWGRTVGKLAAGTRVVRRVDGGRVGWASAAIRALVPVAFSAVPQLGVVLGIVVYAFALFGPLRQGLHDRAAGTLVVLNAPVPAR